MNNKNNLNNAQSKLNLKKIEFKKMENEVIYFNKKIDSLITSLSKKEVKKNSFEIKQDKNNNDIFFINNVIVEEKDFFEALSKNKQK